MKSFEDHAVIGVGDDPETAIKDALTKGYMDPVLFYTIFLKKRWFIFTNILILVRNDTV